MFDKNKALKVLPATLAPMIAVFVVVILSKVDSDASPVLLGLVFLAAWAGLYLAITWLFIDHAAELEAKYPITPEDQKRRREGFHDWLERH
jgi:hypothetical protein